MRAVFFLSQCNLVYEFFSLSLTLSLSFPLLSSATTFKRNLLTVYYFTIIKMRICVDVIADVGEQRLQVRQRVEWKKNHQIENEDRKTTIFRRGAFFSTDFSCTFHQIRNPLIRRPIPSSTFTHLIEMVQNALNFIRFSRPSTITLYYRVGETQKNHRVLLHACLRSFRRVNIH